MSNEEIRLDRYIAAVWRAKWLIIAVVILAGAVAAITSRNQSISRIASITIKTGHVWKEPIEDPYLSVDVATNHESLDRISPLVGLKPQQLARSIAAEPVFIGPRRSHEPIAVKLTATAASEDEAKRIVQAFADELLARHRKLYTDLMAPHLERERRIEHYLRDPAVLSSTRELVIKLEDDLAQVRFNNTSALVTHQSEPSGEPEIQSGSRSSIWRSVVAAGLIAAVVAVLASALTANFGARSTKPTLVKREHASGS